MSEPATQTIYPVEQGNASASIPAQAENDAQALNLWLHGKAEKTARAYKRQVRDFLHFVNKPIRTITLADIQAYQDHLAESGMKASSQNTVLMALKSLFSFCQKIGYTAFNVAAPVKGQPVKSELAERILTEAEVQAMIHLEPSARNQALLRFLYATGARAQEVSHLKFRDVSECEEGAVVTLFGKRGQTRHVMIPRQVWKAIKDLHGLERWPDKPLFVSRNKRGHLTASMIWRIVREAARRAGVEKEVSPHFLRHSCASHSLDRGCPIHTLQATLGHQNLSTTGRYTHVRPRESAGMYLAV